MREVLRLRIIVWAALMTLLTATLLLAQVPMGRFNTVVSLSIAVAKTVLIALFYMQLRRSGPLLRLIAVAGFLWLMLLLWLTLGDVLTRPPGPPPW